MLHYITLNQNHTTLQLQLQYAALHYTNYITPHSTALHSLHSIPSHSAPLHYVTLHDTEYNYSYRYNYNYATLHYIRLHYTTRHSLHHHKFNSKWATLIALHHNYNSIPLQLQLRYTTVHPLVVGEVTSAPIATIPKKTQIQPPFCP